MRIRIIEERLKMIKAALIDFTLDLVENQYESNKVSGPGEEPPFKGLFKEKANDLPLFVEEIQGFCVERKINATQAEINEQIEILIKEQE